MDSNDNKSEIDRWLDGELKRYARVVPRAGLEMRVAANLREERERLVRRHRWWWAAGTVAVTTAIVVAVWMAGTSTRMTLSPIVERPKQTPHEAAVERTPPTMPPAIRPTPRTARHPSGGQIVNATESDRAPMLDRFPSPAPLSEQEEMLARYVQEFPEKAVMMARAQTELRKQNQREMASPWPNVNANGPEQ